MQEGKALQLNKQFLVQAAECLVGGNFLKGPLFVMMISLKIMIRVYATAEYCSLDEYGQNGVTSLHLILV